MILLLSIYDGVIGVAIFFGSGGFRLDLESKMSSLLSSE